MKKIILIVLILLATACANQQQGEIPAESPGMESMPAPAMGADLDVPSFDTKEDLFDAIYEAREAKENAENGVISAFEAGNEGYDWRLDEITQYFDFKNVPDEVRLVNIGASHGMVSVFYRSMSGDYEGPGLYLGIYGVFSDYIEYARKGTPPTEIYHNGNLIIKKEIYRDGVHIVNQYYWIEDGHNIFLKVYPWLLDLYPEETFFEVEVVEVPSVAGTMGAVDEEAEDVGEEGAE